LLGFKPSYVKEKQNPNNSVYDVELKQYFKPINSVLWGGGGGPPPPPPHPQKKKKKHPK